jgi:hypothetical protein
MTGQIHDVVTIDGTARNAAAIHAALATPSRRISHR